MQFHETRRGAIFFDMQLPALVRELKNLNENLKPKKMERMAVSTDALPSCLDEGWKPILRYQEHGTDFIVLEREATKTCK